MRTTIAVALLLLSWAACGRGTAPPTPSPRVWPALTYVPAETPYLLASLVPLPAAVRAKMSSGADQQLARATETLGPLLAGVSGPGGKALASLLAELRAQPLSEWARSSGFSDGGRFVLYGLSLWPVLRIELERADAAEALIGRTLRAAELPTAPLPRGAWRIWSHDLGAAALGIALSQQELVLTVMPAPQLARAWSRLLGEVRISPSFAERDALAELRARHGFLPLAAFFVDTRAVVSLLSGRATGEHAELAPAPLIDQVCAQDAMRLAELMPRLAFGYQRLDLASFRGALVAEVPAWATAALERLRARVPGITWPITGKPIFALGLAIDLQRVAELTNTLGQVLERSPFLCPALAKLNEAPRALDFGSLPPLLAQARGLELVLDEYVEDPPSASGHFAMQSAQMAALPSVLAQLPVALPAPLQQEQPFELPLGNLAPSWLASAHGLWGAQRLVLTVGGDGARRTRELYRAPVPERSPLLVLAYDVRRLAALAPSLDSLTRSSYREVALALEVDERGLRLELAGTW